MMLTDGPHGLRKQAGDADHVGLNDSVPATCFPVAATLACTWDPALLEEVGAALGREARAEDVAVLLGPWAEPQAAPARRAQLRVLLRGPVPVRHPGRRARPRHPGRGRGRLPEALRGQQPGDRTDGDRHDHRRADPARALPARLRDRGRDRRPGHPDDLVQPGERAVRVRQRAPGRRGPAGRVGLRRPGDVRLGRHQRPCRRPGRRDGPRDARRVRRVRRRHRGGRRRGPARRVRPEPFRDPAGGAGPALAGPPRRRSRTFARLRRPPRPGPSRCIRRHCPADQRRAAAPARRGHDRGHRGVRGGLALPGRGQLEGQPHPDRRPARLDHGADSRAGRGPLRRRLRPGHRRHHPRPDGRGSRGRPLRRPRRARPRTSRRGSRPRRWIAPSGPCPRGWTSWPRSCSTPTRAPPSR